MTLQAAMASDAKLALGVRGIMEGTAYDYYYTMRDMKKKDRATFVLDQWLKDTVARRTFVAMSLYGGMPYLQQASDYAFGKVRRWIRQTQAAPRIPEIHDFD